MEGPPKSAQPREMVPEDIEEPQLAEMTAGDVGVEENQRPATKARLETAATKESLIDEIPGRPRNTGESDANYTYRNLDYAATYNQAVHPRDVERLAGLSVQTQESLAEKLFEDFIGSGRSIGKILGPGTYGVYFDTKGTAFGRKLKELEDERMRVTHPGDNGSGIDRFVPDKRAA